MLDHALRQVQQWLNVPIGWCGYRPEPFVAERLWACQRTLQSSSGEAAETPGRLAGLDERGDVLILGPAGQKPECWDPERDVVDLLERKPDRVRILHLSVSRRVGSRKPATSAAKCPSPRPTGAPLKVGHRDGGKGGILHYVLRGLAG